MFHLSLFALTALAVAPVKPSIRWYSPALNMTDVAANRDIFDGINYCCGIFSIHDGGKISTKNATEVKQLTQEFHKLGIEVFLVGGPDGDAILNGQASLASEAVVKYVNEVGADGMIVDYEPSSNYTTHHAELYNSFLKSLKTAATASGTKVQVGMDVAGWGILDNFDVYKTSEIDIYTSMTPTYNYQSAVDEKGQQFVSDMSKTYGAAGRFGIGSSATMRSGKHCTYNWTGDNLYPWLTGLPMPAIDIWRCDIDNMGVSDPDFLDALRRWKA